MSDDSTHCDREFHYPGEPVQNYISCQLTPKNRKIKWILNEHRLSLKIWENPEDCAAVHIFRSFIPFRT